MRVFETILADTISLLKKPLLINFNMDQFLSVNLKYVMALYKKLLKNLS